MLRICKTCGQEKHLSEFSKTGIWYRNKCKDCYRIQKRILYKNKTLEDRKTNYTNKVEKVKILIQETNQSSAYNFESFNTCDVLCNCCGKYYPLHCFKKDTRFKSGYSKKCVTCMGDVTTNITKICSMCGKEKYLHQYGKDLTCNDGRRYGCSECEAEKARIISLSPEIKDRNRKKCRKYRENHLDYDIQRCKTYKKENLDVITEYAERTREDKKIKSKKYYKNPENKKKRYAYKENRMENDEQFRITETLRSRLRSAFNDQGLKKNKRSCEYGIDWKMLSEYLEPLKPNNVDIKLSIDHIIPCSVFDMTNNEHVRLCYLKENLRWCSFSENSTKNNYIIPDLIRKHNLVWLTDYLGINLELHEKENKRIAKYYKQED
jgi:hypothetical protein